MSTTSRKPIQITVVNKLAIVTAQLPAKAKQFLREKLFIVNSEYIIKERLGKPLYDTPKYFDLIDEDPPYVLLPKGFLEQLTAWLDKGDYPYEVTYEYPEFVPMSFASKIALRPEQEVVVAKALVAGEGVIVAPPGSGKSIMGLELIARHDKPALILTHRKQLMDQWVQYIQDYLGVPKKQIGRYSSSYKKPSDYVTVGLLQSFARAKDISALADTFGVIIVDECHHIPARTFRNVISQLNAPHIYGLTATPKRKHNDEQLIYLYIGEIVATIRTNHQQTSSPVITIRETGLQLPFSWKTDQTELLAKVICYDTARNQQIVKDVLSQTKLGKKVLLLSERKEHLKILELYLREHAKVIVFSGDDAASKRSAKLASIERGEYEVLLATGQLIGEGVHIPTINTLVLAFPFAFEGKLTQYIGRLLHADDPTELIDYHDKHVAVLADQFTKRARVYKRL